MKNIFIKIGIGICLIISFILVACIVFHLFFNNKTDQTYYAVFLDNNQVYFGKIASQNSDTMTLREVYYLKVTVNGEIDNTADLALYKMGQELHAPKDTLHINMMHVLYYGELREDSQVVKIIKNKKQKT